MYAELESKIEQMNSLENAEGEIRKINLDLKEMDHQIQLFQRNMTDNSKQAVSSVKNLATLLKRTE